MSTTRTLCLILSFTLVLGSSTSLPVHHHKPCPSNVPSSFGSICHEAENQSSCLALVPEAVPCSGTFFYNDPKSLLDVFVKQLARRSEKVVGVIWDVYRNINDPRESAALRNCVELLEMSVNKMREAIASLKKAVWHEVFQ